jgi:hypothetical protein
MVGVLPTLARFTDQLTVTQLLDILMIWNSAVLVHATQSWLMDSSVSKRPLTLDVTMTMETETSDLGHSSMATILLAVEKLVLIIHISPCRMVGGVVVITAMEIQRIPIT